MKEILHFNVSPNLPKEIKTPYGKLVLKEIVAQIRLGESNMVAGYVLPELSEHIKIACNTYEAFQGLLEQSRRVRSFLNEEHKEKMTKADAEACLWHAINKVEIAFARAGVK